MIEIPEELVTETWQAMSAMSSRQARREMGEAGREQPELLAFVLGSISDCSPQAQELGIYLYFVIHNIFRNASQQALNPVSAAKIEQRLAQNEARLERLESAHPRFLERAAHLEAMHQPFVVKYLVEAIMEAPEGGDPLELTDQESGSLYLVLKTAIDVLDEEMKSAELP